MSIRTPLLTPKPIPQLERPAPFFTQERLAAVALFASGLVGLAFAAVYLLFNSSTPAPPPPPAEPTAAVEPFVPPPDSYPVPIRHHGVSGGYPLPGAKVGIVSFPPAKEKDYEQVHVRKVEILAVRCEVEDRILQNYIYVRLTPEQLREIKRAQTEGDVFVCDYRPDE
jgi:hypothetical protein